MGVSEDDAFHEGQWFQEQRAAQFRALRLGDIQVFKTIRDSRSSRSCLRNGWRWPWWQNALAVADDDQHRSALVACGMVPQPVRKGPPGIPRPNVPGCCRCRKRTSRLGVFYAARSAPAQLAISAGSGRERAQRRLESGPDRRAGSSSTDWECTPRARGNPQSAQLPDRGLAQGISPEGGEVGFNGDLRAQTSCFAPEIGNDLEGNRALAGTSIKFRKGEGSMEQHRGRQTLADPDFRVQWPDTNQGGTDAWSRFAARAG